MRPLLFIVLTLLTLMSSNVHAKKVVHLYIYHNKPPFIVNLKEKKGLYFDLADYLTQRSFIYTYSAVYMPRKRIDHIIENNTLNGVVMGVSPIWFGDRNETKYLWMPAFYTDKDEFISLKSSPFEYSGSASLVNKSVASVAGYYYFNINEAVAQGQLSRIDTIGELQVLELIKKARSDMGLVSRSTYNYYKKNDQIEDIFYVSTVPHDTFDRRAFTTNNNTSVYQDLNRLLMSLQTDSDWQNILQQYE